MRGMKALLITTTAALAIALVPSPKANAQVSIGVNIGAEPGCPYGYYDYAPYDCAPYGYYGPEWFNGGVFLGAGPWFHGPRGFHGSVDRHFDPRNGYHGDHPQRGGAYRPPADNFQNFHASHMSDGHGHFSEAPHGGGHGH